MLRKSLLMVLVKSHYLVFSAKFILAKVGKPKTAAAARGGTIFFGFFEKRQTKPSKRNKEN